MARLLDSQVQPIYALHERWLADVLGPGDSLLTPGAAIWTVDHLDELEQHFIREPDVTKDKRFLEKLHDQLAHVQPQAIQLMAELHVVHFLIITNAAISAAKKRSDIEAILSWMPVPCALPDDVAAAMAPGIVHPGQWMMTRRDIQLTWLIRFSHAWKAQPADHQRTMIEDPWAMKAFAETVQVPASDNARLALLHLAHPDTFEATVSPKHKRLIIDRFANFGGEGEDIDRRLLVARAELTPEYGEDFDWYADPLVHRWWKNSKAWVAFLGWLQRFRALPDFDERERTYKLKIVARIQEARDLALARDKGWFDALRRAFTDRANNLTQWRTHDYFLGWADDDHDVSLRALLELWAGEKGPVERLSRFLECVPTTALGTTGERLNIGTFLLMAEDPASLPPVKIGTFRKAWSLAGWGADTGAQEPSRAYERALVLLDELVRDSGRWRLPLRDRLDGQGAAWDLVNCKSIPSGWSDEEWAAFETWRDSVPSEGEVEEDRDVVVDATVEDAAPISPVDHIAAAARDLHIDRATLDEIVELLDDKGQVVLYGPPGTGKTFLGLRLARAIAEGEEDRVALVQFHPAMSYEDFFEGLRPAVTSLGHVTYQLASGPLVAMAEAAASDPDRRYVLVIDEINRANLPKVFGELLFLLEYRRESARTLYRPEEPFRLPDNLWFIGTMNTADRSVALIDAAMRRRFHFVPFFPHQGPMKGLLRRWLGDGGGRLGVATFLDAVNQELLALVGEHLLIGPSHFMKTDLSDRALARIWTYNVFPMIEEQLWGNPEEIDRWRWEAVRRRFDYALTGSTAEDEHGDEEGRGDEAKLL